MVCDESGAFDLENFHNGNECLAYAFYGCHKVEDGVYVFRVWAPDLLGADLLITVGSEETAYSMKLLSDGESYEVTVRANVGDKYRYKFLTRDNRTVFKADPYAFKSDYPNSFLSVVYDLPKPSAYLPLYERQTYDIPVNIYEVNLLSWKRHADGSYLSYLELKQTLVPYVKEMGYTHVELMPVTEFPYDGSWGYQVTGYFSVTSRLGTPEEFKELIDAFHAAGIKVILDWVPAHFPKDEWGLYEFNGAPLYECPLWDRMEHSGWGTRKFDFGRGEVDSFLLSSAHFFFDIYRIDGLRVDAVASMLYLDYDKPAGDFTPNVYGGNGNLEAIEFIKKFNSVIKRDYNGAITVAEESTSYPSVTKPVCEGGLGFDYKWNMGWMNDVLFYCRQDPYFRNHHHTKLTFSLVYAFSENFILPISHDEVVHVKGSVVNKMPGAYEAKFAGERSLLGFMYAHPGKKLNFMGYEIAQFSEWNYKAGIEFELAEKFSMHAKMQRFVKVLNGIYKAYPPLYEIEDSWDGFKWLVVDDNYNNLIAFARYSREGKCIVAAVNFSGVELQNYKIPAEKGKWRVILNTDDVEFGGAGKLKRKVFSSCKRQEKNDGNFYINCNIPELTCLYLIKE